MQPDKIKRAAEEAQRFLRAIRALADREAADKYAASSLRGGQGIKESGAVRRASLDLTRALAEMRKP